VLFPLIPLGIDCTDIPPSHRLDPQRVNIMMSVDSPLSLKRDHDSFEDIGLEEPCSVPPDFLEKLRAEEGMPAIKQDPDPEPSLPTPPVKRESSPARSATGSLTDAGSATPSFRSQSPMVIIPQSNNAFAAMNGIGSAAPPPKKAKLTFQEREMKRIQKEIKDQERAAEKAKKEIKEQERAAEKAKREAERLAHAEEKARKEAEKEAERAKKEAERLAHAEEKARKDAEKEAKRKKREEEKLKAEEDKRKKERSQLKLGNFFAIPPSKDRHRAGSVDSVGKGSGSMSPAPQGPNPSLLGVASPAAAPTPTKPTSGKPEKSEYEKLFPDFYVKPDVSLAPINRFERDEEAIANIQDTIDSYVRGDRSPGRYRAFDAESLFHLPSHINIPRGKRPMPVREIMTEFYSGGNSSRPIDLTTDSQTHNSQFKRMGDSLRKIPMKFLKFQEDVRPPYRGTYTSRPITGISKLARNPLRRDLPNTDYDYDSEAEWIEDDEDAEELMSEGDNDKEEDDGDEDMDGFLDDENDETAISKSKRSVQMGDLEPISTGLCWEDKKKSNTNVKMIPYRMEIILGNSPFTYSLFSGTGIVC
jgi:chromatin assembly factor 1 subunit A